MVTTVEKPVAADPAKAAKPAADDSANPFAPAPATPATPAADAPKAEPAKPADAVKPVDAAKPADAKKPADAAKPADASVEDPFAPAPAKPAAKDGGSIQAPPASKLTVQVVNVVVDGKVQKTPVVAVVENDPMRVWRDDSGDFEVQAKLVLILDGKVRLLKDTGKFTTVPLDRLSPADLTYVRQHASAMLAKLTAQADSQ